MFGGSCAIESEMITMLAEPRQTDNDALVSSILSNGQAQINGSREKKFPDDRTPPQTVAPGTRPSARRYFIRSTNTEKFAMDWNRVEGNWKQFKGKIKEQWGRLTDDDLDVIAGHRDQLEGKIQERYGIAKDQVRKDVDDWYNAQRW
jgi:uncharacterized protein YjbJ (UPF0337 family)